MFNLQQMCSTQLKYGFHLLMVEAAIGCFLVQASIATRASIEFCDCSDGWQKKRQVYRHFYEILPSSK